MDDTSKELFEACRNGDLNKIKRLVAPENINAQDLLGRKSTPLHFSSGEHRPRFLSHQGQWKDICFPCLQDSVARMW